LGKFIVVECWKTKEATRLMYWSSLLMTTEEIARLASWLKHKQWQESKNVT
jgi:hypothetical protein